MTKARATCLHEKPSWGEVMSDTVNTGIGTFDPAILDLIEPGHNVDWSKDIFPGCSKRVRPSTDMSPKATGAAISPNTGVLPPMSFLGRVRLGPLGQNRGRCVDRRKR